MVYFGTKVFIIANTTTVYVFDGITPGTPITTGTAITSAIIGSDGFLYLGGVDNIYKVNPTTQVVVSTLSTLLSTQIFRIVECNGRLVAVSMSGKIYCISLANFAINATLNAGASVCLSSAVVYGTKVYVVDITNNYIRVVDCTNDSLSANINIIGMPVSEISIDTVNARICVTNCIAPTFPSSSPIIGAKIYRIADLT